VSSSRASWGRSWLNSCRQTLRRRSRGACVAHDPDGVRRGHDCERSTWAMTRTEPAEPQHGTVPPSCVGARSASKVGRAHADLIAGREAIEWAEGEPIVPDCHRRSPAQVPTARSHSQPGQLPDLAADCWQLGSAFGVI